MGFTIKYPLDVWESGLSGEVQAVTEALEPLKGGSAIVVYSSWSFLSGHLTHKLAPLRIKTSTAGA
jgi:hypothetical protein